MRRWALVTSAGFATLASLAACVDLFHATTDFGEGCAGTDAGCARSDAAGDGDVVVERPSTQDFCAWSRSAARANANHACGWLGACAGASGSNRFGACLVNAVSAYDCTVVPTRPVRGAAHDFWDKLWRAEDCDRVRAAVAPTGAAVTCAANAAAYTQCESAAPGNKDGDSLNTCPRTDADAAVPATTIENCAAFGQTCAPLAGRGVCSGSAGPCGAPGVTTCNGTHLHECGANGVDKGIDCASYGAGTCADSGVACAPLGAMPCAADAGTACDHDSFDSCEDGARETIDCAALIGRTDVCDADAGGSRWDIARACGRAIPECTEDTCNGTQLVACVRGAKITVDCASVGLGACVSDDTGVHCAKSPAK